MTGWVEIAVIAFGYQLAVLPGEKVQFIIAGLSTRYNPVLVVAAAGSAFAGWTVLEILLGTALKRSLPEVYLSVITAGLFLLFGGMLYRSAPDGETSVTETDGGYGDVDVDRDVAVLGVGVPDSVVTFFGIFSMMAVGEVGDKTQMVTIGLAAQYGATSAIWVGEMLAIIPISILNAVFFHRFAHRFDLRRAHFAAAAIFVFFGLDTLLAVGTGFSVWETVVTTISRLVMAVIAVV